VVEAIVAIALLAVSAQASTRTARATVNGVSAPGLGGHRAGVPFRLEVEVA